MKKREQGMKGLQEMIEQRCGDDPWILRMEMQKMTMTTDVIKKPALEFCPALHSAQSQTAYVALDGLINPAHLQLFLLRGPQEVLSRCVRKIE